MTHYAMFDDDCELIAVFPAATLAAAVAIKLQCQAEHSKARSSERVFHVREMTPDECRWMQRRRAVIKLISSVPFMSSLLSNTARSAASRTTLSSTVLASTTESLQPCRKASGQRLGATAQVTLDRAAWGNSDPLRPTATVADKNDLAGALRLPNGTDRSRLESPLQIGGIMVVAAAFAVRRIVLLCDHPLRTAISAPHACSGTQPSPQRSAGRRGQRSSPHAPG